MLTQDDLKAISSIVEEKIDALEVRVYTKFDALHEHMEGMENRLVTKSHLDEKLAFYVKRPF